MSVKFCNECGHKNIRAAKFCLECGFRFEDAVPEKKANKPKAEKKKVDNNPVPKQNDTPRDKEKIEVINFSPFKIVDPVIAGTDTPVDNPTYKPKEKASKSIPRKVNNENKKVKKDNKQVKPKPKISREDTNAEKIKKDNHSKVKTKVPGESLNVSRGFNIGKKAPKKDVDSDQKKSPTKTVKKQNDNNSKPSTSDFINKSVKAKPSKEQVKVDSYKESTKENNPKNKSVEDFFNNGKTKTNNTNNTRTNTNTVKTAKSNKTSPAIGSLDMFLNATKTTEKKTQAQIAQENQAKIKKEALLAAKRKEEKENQVNKPNPSPFAEASTPVKQSSGPVIKKLNIPENQPSNTYQESDSVSDEVYEDEVYEDDVIEDIIDDVIVDVVDDVIEDIIDDVIDDIVDEEVKEDVIKEEPKRGVVQPAIQKVEKPVEKEEELTPDKEIVKNTNPNAGLIFEVRGSADGHLEDEESFVSDGINTNNDIDIDSLTKVTDKTLASSDMDFSYLADEESELDRNRLTSGVKKGEVEEEELPESELSGRSVASRLEAKRDLITQKDIDKRKLYIIDQEKEVIPSDVIQDEYYNNVKPIDHDLAVSKKTVQEMFQDRAAIIILVVVAPIIFGVMTFIMSLIK